MAYGAQFFVDMLRLHSSRRMLPAKSDHRKWEHLVVYSRIFESQGITVIIISCNRIQLGNTLLKAAQTPRILTVYTSSSSLLLILITACQALIESEGTMSLGFTLFSFCRRKQNMHVIRIGRAMTLPFCLWSLDMSLSLCLRKEESSSPTQPHEQLMGAEKVQMWPQLW